MPRSQTTSHTKSASRLIALCANMGPVLVLSLLIYCISISSAGRPFATAVYGAGEDPAVLAFGMGDAAVPLGQYDASTGRMGAMGGEGRASEGNGAANVPMTSGWTISVCDERAATLASVEHVYEVLEEVKKFYYPEGNELDILCMEFVEKVDIFSEVVPVSNLRSPEQAFEILTEGRENEIAYKVVKGDSYWTIAKKFDIDPDELKFINNAPNDKLQIGQMLKINSPEPVLSVKTNYRTLLEEKIPFETVYKSNANAWESQTKVLSAGMPGVKEVRYEIAQINGILVERAVLEENVISDPVTQVIERGTKRILASRSDPAVQGSGVLKWPASGRITSNYGKRGSGTHSGIDIAAKIGDPIYSAAAGTVIAASTYHAYGQRIIVDHGNGLTTVYAHLSEYKVSVGQSVGEQELLGLAGRTGRTTGPHLHFEVRVDGKVVNPNHYLK